MPIRQCSCRRCGFGSQQRAAWTPQQGAAPHATSRCASRLRLLHQTQRRCLSQACTSCPTVLTDLSAQAPNCLSCALRLPHADWALVRAAPQVKQHALVRQQAVTRARARLAVLQHRVRVRPQRAAALGRHVRLDPADVLAAAEAPLAQAVPACVQALRAAAPAARPGPAAS